MRFDKSGLDSTTEVVSTFFMTEILTIKRGVGVPIDIS
jgi:hypothetical protein